MKSYLGACQDPLCNFCFRKQETKWKQRHQALCLLLKGLLKKNMPQIPPLKMLTSQWFNHCSCQRGNATGLGNDTPFNMPGAGQQNKYQKSPGRGSQQWVLLCLPSGLFATIKRELVFWIKANKPLFSCAVYLPWRETSIVPSPRGC